MANWRILFFDEVDFYETPMDDTLFLLHVCKFPFDMQYMNIYFELFKLASSKSNTWNIFQLDIDVAEIYIYCYVSTLPLSSVNSYETNLIKS